MNKEIQDALSCLLSMALENDKYESQKEQYKIVNDYITNLQEENERLNNIINELEKWLKEGVKTIGKNRRSDYVNGILNGYINSFRKLQELKGSCKDD